jgi:Cu-processing system permease protein
MEQMGSATVQASLPPEEHRTQSWTSVRTHVSAKPRGRLLYAVFQLALVQASRGVWFYIVLAAAVLAGGALAYAAAGIPGLDAANRFRNSLYSLMGLSSYLLPLLGLLVGALDLAGDQEAGMLHLLAAQPGYRYQIILGKYLGLAALLILTSVAMVSSAGLALAVRGLLFPYEALLGFCGLAVALTALHLGLGLAIGSLSSSRLTALVAALALWLSATFLYDLAIFTLLGWGAAGQLPAMLALALIVNPLDAFRLLTLMLMDSLTALGPSAAALLRMVPPLWAAVALSFDLLLWIGGSLLAATLSLARRDL